MIDWVSIVRHSRRRFSSYVGNRPIRMKKRRRTPPPHISSPTDDGNHLHYSCCCSNVSVLLPTHTINSHWYSRITSTVNLLSLSAKLIYASLLGASHSVQIYPILTIFFTFLSLQSQHFKIEDEKHQQQQRIIKETPVAVRKSESPSKVVVSCLRTF